MNLQKASKRKVIISFVIVIAIIAIFVVVQFRNDSVKVKQSAKVLKTLSYQEVQDGEEVVDNTENNVKFDAFFMSNILEEDNVQKLRGTCNQPGEEDTLYVNLSVNNGTLKNAEILVNYDDGTSEGNVGNMYLETSLEKDALIAENVVGNNVKTIKLNSNITNISETLECKVHSGDYSYESKKLDALCNDYNNYTKINNITLKGTYEKDGESLEIEKKVEFTVDWYGETSVDIPEYAYTSIQNTNQKYNLKLNKSKLNLNFDIYTQETKNQLLLQGVNVNATLPELNGYNPESVRVIAPNSYFDYDEETRNLNIHRSESNGNLIDGQDGKNRINKFKVEVTYPIEAYDNSNVFMVSIPVEAYYEGYNNTSAELGFENPFISESASQIIYVNYIANDIEQNYVETSAGKVSKNNILKLYNGIKMKKMNKV